jgi:hypothetical protein
MPPYLHTRRQSSKMGAGSVGALCKGASA